MYQIFPIAHLRTDFHVCLIGGVSIISSITPDIAWRSQTVTLWLRNCASCSLAFADLEKTPAASLPLVPAPLLALGGFCIQKWQDACINLYDQEQRGRRRKSQQEDGWQCSNVGALRTPHACFQGKGDRAGVNICPKNSETVSANLFVLHN